MKIISILLVTIVCSPGTSFAQHASKPRLVANLIRKELADGCGCYFKFRGANKNSAKYMFVEGADDDPWMNIAGRDIRLRRVKESERGERERVGSSHMKTYAADDISVTSTYVATRVCPHADENCESHEYKATFVVRKGKKTETVKAVGWCGC